VAGPRIPLQRDDEVAARGGDWGEAASVETTGVAKGVPWRARAVPALAALGVGIAGYLTWVHYSGLPALCTGVGGCETVQASRYATVVGVPVALLGLVLYLAVLGLGLWRVVAWATVPSLVPLALFGLTLAGTLYSAYLTYLELFVIGAICPWCVASAALVTTLFALATWDVVEPPV
jgi:uncharacterized membrane protein